MMSSTPRVIPPAKSSARNRGMIAFSMMSLETSVGERAFEAVADLDAHLALVRRHDQQHAVVLVLLPDLPVAAELTPKSSIEVPCSDFSVTTTSWSVVLASSVGELLRERRPGRRIENAGLVDHAAGRARGSRAPARGGRHNRQEGSRAAMRSPHEPTREVRLPERAMNAVAPLSAGGERARRASPGCARLSNDRAMGVRTSPAAAASRPPPP